MRKIIFILFLVLFLFGCATETVEDNSSQDLKQVKMPSIILHTVEKPYGLDHTCPNQTIESYVNIKMNNIVSGNMTSFTNNTCTGQIKDCQGHFDISRELNNKCWVLDCHVYTPDRMGNSGMMIHEYRPCDAIEIQNQQNNINLNKELSWEILIE